MSAFSISLGGGSFGGFGLNTPFRFNDPLSEKSPTTSEPSTKTGNGVLDVIGIALNDATKAFGAYSQADLLSQQIKAGQRPSIVQGKNGVPQGEQLSQIVAAGGNVAGALGGATGLLGGIGASTLIFLGIGLLIVLLLFRR